MDAITFSVTLRDGFMENGFMRYEPGSVVSGLAQIIPSQDVNARGASVRMQWRTEGRGDTNSASFGQIEIWKGNLVKGRPIQGEFRFQLPPEPWSYTGHYLTIIWEILIFVDVALAADPKFSQPFIMRPSPNQNR